MTATALAQRVPVSVWAGLAVLALGLGASLAVLTGFGQSMACGTFGLDCIAAAFGMVLFTLCVALVLLLRGMGVMRRSRKRIDEGGGWFSVAKVLTMGIAAVLALGIVLMAGFAALVLLR